MLIVVLSFSFVAVGLMLSSLSIFFGGAVHRKSQLMLFNVMAASWAVMPIIASLWPSLPASRLVFFFALTMVAALFAFSMSELKQKSAHLTSAAAAISLLLGLVSTFTGLVVTSQFTTETSSRLYEVDFERGPLYPLVTLAVIGIGVLAMKVIWSESNTDARYRFLFFGILLGILISTITNVILPNALQTQAPALFGFIPYFVWAASLAAFAIDYNQISSAITSRRLNTLNNSLETATHHAKSPLSSLNILHEMLEESRDLSPSERKLLDSAKEETIRLHKTIESLETTPKSQRVNLSVLAKQAIKNTRQTRRFSNTITEEIYVIGNEFELSELLQNLLENALKYSPEKSSITFKLRTSETHAIVSVSNESATLSKRELSRLFEKGYRTAGAKQKGAAGSGNGLAIAKRIVESLGGQISATSKSQQTTLTIKLPLAIPSSE